MTVGDQIRRADGRLGQVEALEFVLAPQPMYNLTVAEAHTYFVGEGQWLVHNSCPIHGNSKLSQKSQHGYEIFEKETGDVVKTGISSKSLNKNGTSPRANRQVNALNKRDGGEVYDATIVKTNLPNRTKALEWERKNAQKLFDEGNSMREHKRPKPWK